MKEINIVRVSFLGYNSSYFITTFINNFRISGSFDTEEPECEAIS
jgi:hypothetical protein